MGHRHPLRGLTHLLGGHTATSPFTTTFEDHIANADTPNLLRTIFQNPDAIRVLMELNMDEAVGAFRLLGAYFDRVDGTIHDTKHSNHQHH